MTENEAIERLKCMRLFMQINDKDSTSKFLDEDYIANDLAIKALEEIQQYRAIGTVKYFKECSDIIKKTEANELAKIIDEWLLYQKIGTVEECREVRERQIGKKPTRFYKKYGKHKWRRKENGEIDDFAWEFDYHSGVACEICGETVCVHCNPNYDELDDCEEEHWNCPNCGKRVGWKSKYCDCGQAIDWSE